MVGTGLASLLLAGCALQAIYADLETLGIRIIPAETLWGMLQRQEALTLVDARDERFYQESRLPGAISVPAPDLPPSAVDIRRTDIRLGRAERLPAAKTRLLVFYCGSTD